MKKTLLFILLFLAQKSFCQTWYNDTLTNAFYHGTAIDTLYLDMSELRNALVGGQTITLGTDLSGSGTSTLNATIVSNAITTSKINNSAVTLAKIANASANSKLLGSGSAGSSSPYSELTLGANLSMSGTTLNTSAVSLTRTTVDLTDGFGNAVLDSNMQSGALVVVSTSKPATPQWKKGVRTQDEPSTGSGAYVGSWEAWVTFGGKNNDLVNSRTINWRITLNGTDMAGASDGTQAVAIATPFWKVIGRFTASAINVGDTIGIKLWGSAASQLDLRYVTIYIVPHTYARITNGFEIFYLGATQYFQATMAGAVSGVTYAAVNQSYTYGMADNNIGVVGFTITALNPSILADPMYLSCWNSASPSNSNALIQAVTAAAQLYSLSGALTTGNLRYFYVYK